MESVDSSPSVTPGSSFSPTSSSMRRTAPWLGRADYFEQFAVLGPLPSCCGSQGGFEVNAYFGHPSALTCTLFGLGFIAVSFDSQLFESFTSTVDAEFPTASSGWELAWTCAFSSTRSLRHKSCSAGALPFPGYV